MIFPVVFIPKIFRINLYWYECDAWVLRAGNSVPMLSTEASTLVERIQRLASAMDFHLFLQLFEMFCAQICTGRAFCV